MNEEKVDFEKLTDDLDLSDLEQIQAAVHARKHPRPNIETRYVSALTPTEKKLVEIWTDLLNVEQIGIHDNFFDLGGHSLMVTQLLSRVYETFHVELPINALFASDPTIAELARAVTEQQIEQATPDELAAELDALSNLTDAEIMALLSAENDTKE